MNRLDNIVSWINKLELKDLQKPLSKILVHKLNIWLSRVTIDEDLLNQVWCIKHAGYVKISYLEAFSKIQNKEYRSAWNDLVDVEVMSNNLLRLMSKDYQEKLGIINILNISQQLMEMIVADKSRLIFFSAEIKVKYYTCSICGLQFKRIPHCGHFPGCLYSGKFCKSVAGESEIIGASHVRSPRRKKCLVTEIEGIPFNKLFNFYHLDELMKGLSSPLQNWSIDNDIIVKDPRGDRRHFSIQPFNKTIYNKRCVLKLKERRYFENYEPQAISTIKSNGSLKMSAVLFTN